MNKLAVLFALLLAACATPTARAPATPETTPAKTGAPLPESSHAVPDVARAAPSSAPSASLFKEFVARNDEKLLDVYPGMHKSELIRIMHTDPSRWHNPYKREALHDSKGAAYEVFYYLTRDPEGKPVKERHLTPVIVKDDTVAAIGAYRLKKLKRGESVDLPRRAPKRSS